MTRKKVDNSQYKVVINIGAPKYLQLLWYLVSILLFKNSFFTVSSIKVAMLRFFGAKVGEGVRIKPRINIKFPWKLSIGNNSWIGEDVWIDNLSEVTIGSNVTISQGALILTGSHDTSKVAFDYLSYPIIIEDGVWLGSKSIISGGITCGTHSILGLGSVSERDLQPYFIYKGNPAIPVLERRMV